MRSLFNLAMLSALTVGTAAAQDKVSELEENVNAAGFTRRSMPLRLGAEAGMGLLGEALILGTELYVIPLLGIPPWGDEHLPIVTLLAGPAVMAGGVALGGRWTGGRGSFGWTILGSYGGLLALVGAYNLSNLLVGSADWANLISIPLWSLVGSIVAYEISDRSATNKLKDKRKGALKSAGEPLMFQLLTLPF